MQSSSATRPVVLGRLPGRLSDSVWHDVDAMDLPAVQKCVTDSDTAQPGPQPLAPSSQGQRGVHANNEQGRLLSDPDAAALRYGPQVPPSLPPLHLNLLVVGDSALGKSSFMYDTAIRFGAAPGDLNACLHEGTTLNDFKRQPDALCTALPDIPLPSALRTLKLRLQDTPGYGDTMNPGGHLRAVVRWLLQQQSRDYEWAGGANAMVRHSMGVLPHAATLCIFFVSPHRMRPVDLEYLAALSKLVAVIPVIAKADCHTPEELEEHRQRILAALSERKGQEGQPEPVHTFRFSSAALRDKLQLPAKDLERLRAFSVISSRHLEPLRLQQSDSAARVEDGGVKDGGGAGTLWVPVRTYPWGSASALLREHSDTVLLQRLLLEDVWTVMEEARSRYLAFCEQYDAAGRDLGVMLEAAVAPFEEACLKREVADAEEAASTWGPRSEADPFHGAPATRTAALTEDRPTNAHVYTGAHERLTSPMGSNSSSSSSSSSNAALPPGDGDRGLEGTDHGRQPSPVQPLAGPNAAATSVAADEVNDWCQVDFGDAPLWRCLFPQQPAASASNAPASRPAGSGGGRAEAGGAGQPRARLPAAQDSEKARLIREEREAAAARKQKALEQMRQRELHKKEQKAARCTDDKVVRKKGKQQVFYLAQGSSKGVWAEDYTAWWEAKEDARAAKKANGKAARQFAKEAWHGC